MWKSICKIRISKQGINGVRKKQERVLEYYIYLDIFKLIFTDEWIFKGRYKEVENGVPIKKVRINLLIKRRLMVNV